jgi:hypothetical protein
MAPLPPWIRSIKRPLDKLTHVRRSFEDLPDTEPGEVLPAITRLRGPERAKEDAGDDAAEVTDPPERDR